MPYHAHAGSEFGAGADTRMKKSQQPYLAFSTWRVQLYRSQKPRHSVRFFRRSRNHSLLWNFVMQGYYSGSPPSVGACEEVTAWSRPTTRKLLQEAQARGFLDLRAASEDHRKRLVIPTAKTVSEYEAMVNGYMGLWKTLKKR